MKLVTSHDREFMYIRYYMGSAGPSRADGRKASRVDERVCRRSSGRTARTGGGRKDEQTEGGRMGGWTEEERTDGRKGGQPNGWADARVATVQ